MSRQLPRRIVSEYNRKIKRQGDAAARSVSKALETYLRENPDATVEEVRDFAFELMQAAGDLYGNACSQAALDLQYEIAEEFGAKPPDIGGWLYEPDADSIAKTAQKHANKFGSGDVEGFVDGVAEGARYYTERGANATMAQTARKQASNGGKKRRKGAAANGVRFARVPMGVTTCDFCIMLASRGFAYLSEESAGEHDQYHPNCDCRIVPNYEDGSLEGYDPVAYRRIHEGFQELDKRDDLAYGEKKMLQAAIVDANIPLGRDGCRDMVKSMQSCIKRAFGQYQKTGGRKDFDRHVNRLLDLIGKQYGIEISATYEPKDSDRYSPCPLGEEVFAVCRVAGKYEKATFLSLSKQSGVLNVDLMMDGKYVDVKCPKSSGKLGRRLKHAADQCREMGQEKGVSIICDLNYEGDFSKVEEKGREFVNNETMELVTIVRMDGRCYDL